ncbi:MAG: T9SS type A sorting domain-containing protein, partial [Bacteroidia bacterium]|nr:T9SS type A sorting domain-containing protein [Bacteroidia bacterium]MDW8334597.1 T9SS type A sorting domain-containing protein [Bacteroidia bacterium]
CFPQAERTFEFAVERIDNDGADIALYPNPTDATAVLFVKSGKICHLVVYDVHGRPVYRTTFAGRTEIPATLWPSGIYRVVVNDGRATTTLSVVR